MKIGACTLAFAIAASVAAAQESTPIAIPLKGLKGG